MALPRAAVTRDRSELDESFGETRFLVGNATVCLRDSSGAVQMALLQER